MALCSAIGNGDAHLKNFAVLYDAPGVNVRYDRRAVTAKDGSFRFDGVPAGATSGGLSVRATGFGPKALRLPPVGSGGGPPLHLTLSVAQALDVLCLASDGSPAVNAYVEARPTDEAISTAGGVVFEAPDPALMLKDMPGVFCAGEMLDGEVPAGRFLLTGCLARGRAAGLGAKAWLDAAST